MLKILDFGISKITDEAERVDDRDDHRLRHAALHVARAGALDQERRRARGHLVARHRALRAARRRASVQRAERAGDHRRDHRRPLRAHQQACGPIRRLGWPPRSCARSRNRRPRATPTCTASRWPSRRSRPTVRRRPHVSAAALGDDGALGRRHEHAGGRGHAPAEQRARPVGDRGGDGGRARHRRARAPRAGEPRAAHVGGRRSRCREAARRGSRSRRRWSRRWTRPRARGLGERVGRAPAAVTPSASAQPAPVNVSPKPSASVVKSASPPPDRPTAKPAVTAAPAVLRPSLLPTIPSTSDGARDVISRLRFRTLVPAALVTVAGGGVRARRRAAEVRSARLRRPPAACPCLRGRRRRSRSIRPRRRRPPRRWPAPRRSRRPRRSIDGRRCASPTRTRPTPTSSRSPAIPRCSTTWAARSRR